MRKWQAAPMVIALVLALAGCGAGKPAPKSPPGEPKPWEEEAKGAFVIQAEPLPVSKQVEGKEGVVKVTVTEGGFSPSVLRVEEGHVVRIYLKNAGQKPHNLVIPRFGVFPSGSTAPGADNYIEFTADAKGDWQFFSDAPLGDGKPEPGLVGTLKVE